VFICGYPYARADPRPTLLAAPVPALERCAGAPVYWTEIVVRADSDLHALPDVFGRRFGFTAPESQSGYQAARHLFAPYARERGQPLFAATVGPLVTPRRVVDAVLAGECDAGPVDAYALALLRATEPGLVNRLRVIASTVPTAIPPLVASAGIGADALARLRAAFGAAATAEALAPVRAQLVLARFATPKAADYDTLLARAREADALGYARLD
jgi:ABC-type phosphate/phosphonate transport system substrate-binding protein